MFLWGIQLAHCNMADALNIKSVGINCHRPMNSVKYWGIINKRSVNIKVPKEDIAIRTAVMIKKSAHSKTGLVFNKY